MNIFYLHEDPVICASWHGDKHVVKMILETAQLLSTAHRILDGEQTIENVNGRNLKRWVHPLDEYNNLLYKATHANHPSAIWIRQSEENYHYAWQILTNLCAQYTMRYGKVHKADREGLVELLENPPTNIGDAEWTNPPQVMPEKYQHRITTTAYQQYYRGEKSHLMTWKNRNNPPPCFRT